LIIYEGLQPEMTEALVTIGIPTFNRPEGLARTLTSICSQTYRNLEIIVSDNASTNRAVKEVVSDFMERDPRVRYHRHPENLGMMGNFSSLVPKASEEFFMWASDDDRWEPFFIARCVAGLLADPALAVCQMEAQYEVAPGVLFPFFFEGAPFHGYTSRSPVQRVKHLLRHVYGNLVYGIFRREALFHDGRPITEWIGRTLNEIPMQILLASWGGIRVLPEVGLYKAAPRNVCEQARWEQVGGPLPNWPGWRGYLAACRSLHQYHGMVMQENFVAIDALGYDEKTSRQLRAVAAYCLLKHELSLALRWKPSGSRALQPIVADLSESAEMRK
jgi:glycosyltransferase involved in cell wall biosynthesis